LARSGRKEIKERERGPGEKEKRNNNNGGGEKKKGKEPEGDPDLPRPAFHPKWGKEGEETKKKSAGKKEMGKHRALARAKELLRGKNSKVHK